MPFGKKAIFLLLIFILGVFLLTRRYWQERECPRRLPVADTLHTGLKVQDTSALPDAETMNTAHSASGAGIDRADSLPRFNSSPAIWTCPDGTILPKLSGAQGKLSWEKTVNSIEAELSRSKDWFDTVEVLSNWLYRNTRVGDIHHYNIDRVLGKTYVLAPLELKYLHELLSSDSLVGTCGFHGYYGVLFYRHFGIKSYCYSMRPDPEHQHTKDGRHFATLAVGHMFNILENPHEGKWYPVDHFFGIRYKHQGSWLDMERYFELASQQRVSEISVDLFGKYKIRIHDTPCVPVEAWDLEPSEIISAERGNHRHLFRIIAPYRLKQQFEQEFKALFDPIAATYGEPPHSDWVDLAQRMPQYAARLFPMVDLDEQLYADTLLKSWRL